MPASPIRRRLVPALAGFVLGVGLLAGCGTGQQQAGSYDDLEAAFLEGCEETSATDAKASEAATSVSYTHLRGVAAARAGPRMRGR